MHIVHQTVARQQDRILRPQFDLATNVNTHFRRAEEIRNKMTVFVVQRFFLIEKSRLDSESCRRMRRCLQFDHATLANDDRLRITHLVRADDQPFYCNHGQRRCRAITDGLHG